MVSSDHWRRRRSIIIIIIEHTIDTTTTDDTSTTSTSTRLRSSKLTFDESTSTEYYSGTSCITSDSWRCT